MGVWTLLFSLRIGTSTKLREFERRTSGLIQGRDVLADPQFTTWPLLHAVYY
jgi:hypothetical protein